VWLFKHLASRLSHAPFVRETSTPTTALLADNRPAPSSAPPDRRVAARYPFDPGKVFYRFGDGRFSTTLWPARVQDLSTGGVGLYVDGKLGVGTLLTIELTNTCKTFSKCYLVRVVHATRQAEEGARIGCAFTSMLPEADLLALLSVPAPQSVDDTDPLPTVVAPGSDSRDTGPRQGTVTTRS
jgi:hypothetical protein